MSRAQSTVIGTIMLVAVVIVTVTVFGTFSIASVLDIDSDPFVEIEGTLDADGLSLTHAGGDNLAISALSIHVSNDTSKSVIAFGDGIISGDGDDRFEPGERWSNDSALLAGDRLTVVVVDNSSDSVLFRGQTNLETTVPPPPTPMSTSTSGTPGTPGTSGTLTATPSGTPTATPTATPTSTPTTSPTPTSTPTPTPDGTPTTTTSQPTSPSVTIVSVAITQPSNHEEQVTVDWSASDPNGDLSSVTISVEDLTGGCSPQSTTNAISGGSASGADAFTFDAHPSHGCGPGDSYRVTVTVEDATGNSASEETTQTE